MKTLPSCLAVLALSTGLLQAQARLEARMSADIQPTPKQFGEVSKDEQRIVVSKVVALLNKHVTFRDDGVAASVYDASNGRHQVEWKNMRIKMLTPTQAKATDQEQNIGRRIQARLVFDSCRILNPKTNVWTEWSVRGHPLFPPAINVVWVNGHPMAEGGMHLKKFRQGPAATPANAATPTDPESDTGQASGKAPKGGGFSSGTGTGGLPPGMKRK